MLTQNQTVECLICYKSPSYFFKTYVSPILQEIRSKRELTELTGDQYYWLESSSKHINMGAGRQTGRTTIMIARGVWRTIFEPNSAIMYISKKNQADHAISLARAIYEKLPEFLKPAIHLNSQSNIQLENGSRFRFNRGSENAARGMTLNMIMLDVIPKDVVYHEMLQCILPCVTATSGIILEAHA
jgi:hypothetical protein